MKITPDTLLSPGTKVTVGTMHGTVIQSSMERAHPSGYICVHKIEFTHKKIRKAGHEYKIVSTPKRVGTVNYSAIQVAV